MIKANDDLNELGGPGSRLNDYSYMNFLSSFLRSKIRKDKIEKIFNEDRKKSSLEPGYVYAPYMPMTTTSVISGYTSKNVSRKQKINKIFGLDLDIKDDFSPSKSIISRYSKRIINNRFYGAIEIKNPLYK